MYVDNPAALPNQTLVYIQSGTQYGNTSWLVDSSGVHQCSSGDSLAVAGNGLVASGKQLSVQVQDSSLIAAPSGLRVADTFAGEGLTLSGGTLSVSSITHLDAVGTITAGKWQGQAVGLAYGGTGSSSLAANFLLASDGSKINANGPWFDAGRQLMAINSWNPAGPTAPDGVGLQLLNRDLQIVGGQLIFGTSGVVLSASSDVLSLGNLARTKSLRLITSTPNPGIAWIDTTTPGNDLSILFDIANARAICPNLSLPSSIVFSGGAQLSTSTGGSTVQCNVPLVIESGIEINSSAIQNVTSITTPANASLALTGAPVSIATSLTCPSFIAPSGGTIQFSANQLAFDQPLTLSCPSPLTLSVVASPLHIQDTTSPTNTIALTNTSNVLELSGGLATSDFSVVSGVMDLKSVTRLTNVPDPILSSDSATKAPSRSSME
ncbi:uncharacterized protein BJ171DRAFT_576129 [Polychytrium aggregatum]|uniref:uncharacterized protein n=1 Tax=Polychytrium aggregatum TaxID=110093 RepID=UPI0022FDDAAE|nr:uncharacterized protein BJ171DRAFT_576129 [Polychytrium aggregatum]KAI9179991.1 hypothetical protein BJ171DRAFT_576129 [Polychytrium aggregatum]